MEPRAVKRFSLELCQLHVCFSDLWFLSKFCVCVLEKSILSFHRTCMGLGKNREN